MSEALFGVNDSFALEDPRVGNGTGVRVPHLVSLRSTIIS
jgi:hypothetical protein